MQNALAFWEIEYKIYASDRADHHFSEAGIEKPGQSRAFLMHLKYTGGLWQTAYENMNKLLTFSGFPDENSLSF